MHSVEEDMPLSPHADAFGGAQKKVETYYYDIRKQVFEYDEVMNNEQVLCTQSGEGVGRPCFEETGDWLPSGR